MKQRCMAMTSKWKCYCPSRSFWRIKLCAYTKFKLNTSFPLCNNDLELLIIGSVSLSVKNSMCSHLYGQESVKNHLHSYLYLFLEGIGLFLCIWAALYQRPTCRDNFLMDIFCSVIIDGLPSDLVVWQAKLVFWNFWFRFHTDASWFPELCLESLFNILNFSHHTRTVLPRMFHEEYMLLNWTTMIKWHISLSTQHSSVWLFETVLLILRRY